MKYFLCAAMLVLLLGCTKERTYKYASPVYRQVQDAGQAHKEQQYSALKSRIKYKQQLFFEEYHRSGEEHRKVLVNLAKKYVYTVLTDTVFPYWYDTKWDYNGTTETPGKGKIACGYFVTTTLKHMGFDINRVKLAQQASSKIIKTICGKNKTHIISNNNIKQLEKYMLSREDGLYIIGLDNHVGFIHKKGKVLSIIHSNGIRKSMQVVSEPLTKSKLVLRSNAFYIGSILDNSEVFKKWILKNKIELQV